MARLHSAGCALKHDNILYSTELEFAYLKAKINLKPNILFESLVEHCKEINSLYITHIIKDNIDNKNMFQYKLNDLLFACEKLGLFVIDKV